MTLRKTAPRWSHEAANRHLGLPLPPSEGELHARCAAVYGANSHVSGALSDGRCCLVVVRSSREDDHSLPQLEAMKKAATQFSRTRPAFIAVQYDDLTVQDLAKVHIRRRAALLSYYLFLKRRESHVSATCFSAYGGVVASAQGVGVPSFGVPNPEPLFTARPSDYAPFLGHVPDEDYIRLIGAPPTAESISRISLTEDESAADITSAGDRR